MKDDGTKAVRYTKRDDCIYKISIKPTVKQSHQLYKVACSTNSLFIELLKILEYISDKYRERGEIERLRASDYYLNRQVTVLRDDYPYLRESWSTSRNLIVHKAMQRNWDRIIAMICIDNIFGMDKKVRKYKRRKPRWIDRLSDYYEDQMQIDPDNFQIPIDLNPRMFDVKSLGLSEYKKHAIKVGGFPAFINTTKGVKLYVPKMKNGIKVKVPKGFNNFKVGARLEEGEWYAYIECHSGRFFVTFYDKKHNYRMPTGSMPRYVRECRNQLEGWLEENGYFGLSGMYNGIVRPLKSKYDKEYVSLMKSEIREYYKDSRYILIDTNAPSSDEELEAEEMRDLCFTGFRDDYCLDVDDYDETLRSYRNDPYYWESMDYHDENITCRDEDGFIVLRKSIGSNRM